MHVGKDGGGQWLTTLKEVTSCQDNNVYQASIYEADVLMQWTDMENWL